MSEQDVLSEASDIKNGNLSNHFFLHFLMFFFFFLFSPVIISLTKRKEKLLFSYTFILFSQIDVTSQNL
jgi:hypothetical protein